MNDKEAEYGDYLRDEARDRAAETAYNETRQTPYCLSSRESSTNRLSSKEAKMLLMLAMSEEENKSQLYLLTVAAEHPLLFAMLKRLEAHLEDILLQPDKLLQIASANSWFMLSVLDGFDSFGKSVMWAYTMLWWRVRLGKPITLEMMSMDIMPMGFPSEKEYNRAWRAQKDGGGNLLDKTATWKPLLDKLVEQSKPVAG